MDWGKSLETVGRPATLVRIARRTLLLFVLGLLYYGGLSHPIEKVRLLGVFAGLLVKNKALPDRRRVHLREGAKFALLFM